MVDALVAVQVFVLSTLAKSISSMFLSDPVASQYLSKRSQQKNTLVHSKKKQTFINAHAPSPAVAIARCATAGQPFANEP